jgi:DNA-binding cell septation regulator SpoVG
MNPPGAALRCHIVNPFGTPEINRYLHEVTEVKLSLRDKEMLRAYVDIVLDDSLVIRDLRIIHNSRGYFVAMPSQPLRDVRRADTALIAHPIYR